VTGVERDSIIEELVAASERGPVRPGRPWAAGDILVRILRPEQDIPAGWTLLDARPGGSSIWQRAVQSGPGDPGVFVATPMLPGGGPDGTAVRWDGAL
jgi:hypothetical protein